MLKTLFLLIFIWPSALLAARPAPRLSPCDAWFPTRQAASGVLLLTHGMNLKPERMDDLARFFAANGFETLRPAFSGHCNDHKKYLEVRSSDWESDARRLHKVAQERAREFRVPLYLAAYSFSALVFQVMSEELPFARRLYFAPALSMRAWYPAVAWLAGFVPGFTHRTLVPSGYYANGEGNQQPLLAFDSFLRRWKEGSGAADATPTLAWVDPADELVSARGLGTLAAKRPHWSLRELKVDEEAEEKRYHHLVIDEASLGAAEWKRVTGEALTFLRKK